MIGIDTNLLVYAHREDSEFHLAALRSLLFLAQGERRWAIPWPCVHEFLAIVTHAKIYSPPSPLELALATIEQWLKSPYCRLLNEGPGYLEHLKHVCLSGKVAGARIHDARIAAICLENGVKELWSADRDFSRFAGLKIHNPLL